MYLRQLHVLAFNPAWDVYFNKASEVVLYVSGLSGTGLILYQVFRAYRRRRRLQQTIAVARVPSPAG
jgi:hypothetical protein